MNSHDEAVIEFDRRKILLGVAGCLFFVVAGVWLVTLDSGRVATEKGFRFFGNNPLFAHATGVLALIFFGGVGGFLIRKMLRKKPGLVFNSEGIVDNAGASAFGLIPWSEIEGYQVFEMSGTKMLIVMVTDPEKYITRGNALKQKLNKANFNMTGSPIYISTKTLRTDIDELVYLFERYLKKYSRDNPDR